MKTKPIQGTIENWGIVYHKPNQFFVVVGEFKDTGCYVRTSGILMLNRSMVETLNSIYLLGKPNQEAAQATFDNRYNG